MINVLLIEDDYNLGQGLEIYLKAEGYHVQWSRDLASARSALENNKLNLIVLDLNLPDGNGFDFLQGIRKQGSKLPVIILTAKSDEDSVVEGLQKGANDYVKKPFSQKELSARIKNVLREPMVRDEQLRYHDLLIVIDKRKVYYSGQELALNRKEFDVLLFLTQRAESVVRRDVLLENIDADGDSSDRTIDSHISHIRTKFRQSEINEVKINSVYGIGYRLEKVSKDGG